MAKGFEKYYAATREGVMHVKTRAPIVKRGAVLAWQCTNLGNDAATDHFYLTVPASLLFDDPETARKATFKLKLKEEQNV